MDKTAQNKNLRLAKPYTQMLTLLLDRVGPAKELWLWLFFKGPWFICGNPITKEDRTEPFPTTHSLHYQNIWASKTQPDSELIQLIG